jgi:hypothetical protein
MFLEGRYLLKAVQKQPKIVLIKTYQQQIFSDNFNL